MKLNKNVYFLTLIAIIIIPILGACEMFYLYFNNSPNYIYLSESDFNISDRKYKNINISDEKEMTDITSQKEFQIYLKDNEYKVRFKFITNESLKDKYIRIHFWTMGINENWNYNYNCSNLGESITIEDGYYHPVTPSLKLNESELNGWYKIINTDLNYMGGHEYCIEFNITPIYYGTKDLFIELDRHRGHKTTVTVNASTFDPIFYDDAKIEYIYPDSINFIFDETNGSSKSTIYLKNRHGDFFLYIGIISLFLGIIFSLVGIWLTFYMANPENIITIDSKMPKRQKKEI